jgi:hypothetical protein
MKMPNNPPKSRDKKPEVRKVSNISMRLVAWFRGVYLRAANVFLIAQRSLTPVLGWLSKKRTESEGAKFNQTDLEISLVLVLFLFQIAFVLTGGDVRSKLQFTSNAPDN